MIPRVYQISISPMDLMSLTQKFYLFKINLFVLFSCLFFWFLTGVFLQEAHAQNRCPPGQREITILGVPSTGQPACTSRIPKGTTHIPNCPKTRTPPPKKFIPGINVKYSTALPKQNGHRYIDVGPGKFAKIYLGRCLDINNSINIHNGERVVVKNANRQKGGDIGRACFNNKCGIIFLADLKPLTPRVGAGRRADEGIAPIEGLDEKFYVAVPQGKKLYMYRKPSFNSILKGKLADGTKVFGSPKNHPQAHSWKLVCTTKNCGYVLSEFLKQDSPNRMKGPKASLKKVLQLSIPEIWVYEKPDGLSRELGTLKQHQFVDVYETVTNKLGDKWTRVCNNGCGWVLTNDLK